MSSTSMPQPFWGDIHHSPSLNSTIQLPTFKVSMDQESVLSGHSDRPRRSRGQGLTGISHSNSNHVVPTLSHHGFNTLQHTRSNHHNHHSTSSTGGHRSNSRHVHRTNRHERTFISKLDSPDERHERRREEVIEVQILPQDDNWGDNTTAITGNTSDHTVSVEADLNKLGKELYWNEQNLSLRCQMWTGTIVAGFLSFCAFLSPIVMVILPKVETLEWNVKECGPECDGLLISFSFKLLILAVGTWALFCRKPRATMPRIFIYRSVVLAFVFVFMISYWLFYSVRIAERRHENELSYHSIVLFAVSLVDALLFIHYLAVILIEVRHLQPQFFIKVVRSPDGESHSYNIGDLTIQRSAVWVLERYYRDFSIYNPYLETLPSKNSRKKSLVSALTSTTGNHISSPNSAIKYYDVDGLSSPYTNGPEFSGVLIGGPTSSSNVLDQANSSNRSLLNGSLTSKHHHIGDETSSKRGKSSGYHHHHNERFYEEHEYERRVKKRRARLITATEEAFTHIKRVNFEQPGPAIPMEPDEAAQAIFPSMARSLQKYLRITRQQPRHSMQSILTHLSTCLTFDLSPKAFLEKYIVSSPVLQNEKENKSIQTWGLVCNILLSRGIEPGTVFMLRQGDVSLLVTVHSLPHFNITEEIIDRKSNKFVFKLNSETSV